MVAPVVGSWLGTPVGRIFVPVAVFLSFLLVTLALAGFDFASGLLLVLIGGPVGLAAAYPVSGLLRHRRGANRVPRLFGVWIAYVVLTALVIAGDFVFVPADPRTGSSGTFLAGFLQSFGLCFWLLLVPLSRGARLTDNIGQRWFWAAFGLHFGGMAAGLFVALAVTFYVLWPLTR